MPRLHRVIVAALATLLALLGLPAAATHTAAAQTTAAPSSPAVQTGDTQPFGDVGHYAALGDSFASGPFIPVQRADPAGCARSTRNYPSLVAASLGVDGFTDISCSGAVTANMTVPQAVPLGINPPQFNALRPDTDLVTVSIGGNDIGYFDILRTCTRLSFNDPLRDPCKRHATASGTDIYAERVLAAAPKIAAVLKGIRERSPDANVLLVGYLRILPPVHGCWPQVPIARGDVPYLDGIHQQLTAMLAEQARDNGALFIDPYAGSLGHDSCQPAGVRWVEGIIPASPAYPVHPNAIGMRAVADLILSHLRQPVSG